MTPPIPRQWVRLGATLGRLAPATHTRYPFRRVRFQFGIVDLQPVVEVGLFKNLWQNWG